MKPEREPTTPERPGARGLRGEGERSYEQANRRPEDIAEREEDIPEREEEEDEEERVRREDLTVAPEDLAARFLSDAVQGDTSSREGEGRDTPDELPVADDEDELRDRSRADLPPAATPEGEPR